MLGASCLKLRHDIGRHRVQGDQDGQLLGGAGIAERVSQHKGTWGRVSAPPVMICCFVFSFSLTKIKALNQLTRKICVGQQKLSARLVLAFAAPS